MLCLESSNLPPHRLAWKNDNVSDWRHKKISQKHNKTSPWRCRVSDAHLYFKLELVNMNLAFQIVNKNAGQNKSSCRGHANTAR